MVAPCHNPVPYGDPPGMKEACVQAFKTHFKKMKLSTGALALSLILTVPAFGVTYRWGGGGAIKGARHNPTPENRDVGDVVAFVYALEGRILAVGTLDEAVEKAVKATRPRLNETSVKTKPIKLLHFLWDNEVPAELIAEVLGCFVTAGRTLREVKETNIEEALEESIKVRFHYIFARMPPPQHPIPKLMQEYVKSIQPQLSQLFRTEEIPLASREVIREVSERTELPVEDLKNPNGEVLWRFISAYEGVSVEDSGSLEKAIPRALQYIHHRMNEESIEALPLQIFHYLVQNQIPTHLLIGVLQALTPGDLTFSTEQRTEEIEILLRDNPLLTVPLHMNSRFYMNGVRVFIKEIDGNRTGIRELIPQI